MPPDNNIINASGTYFVVHRTTLGYDSIRFFKVVTDKKTSLLNLGNDACVSPGDSLKLNATSGN